MVSAFHEEEDSRRRALRRRISKDMWLRARALVTRAERISREIKARPSQKFENAVWVFAFLRQHNTWYPSSAMWPEPVCLSCVLAWSAVSSAADVESVKAVNNCRPAPQSVQIGDRATCPFSRIIHEDFSRIPPKIPMVRCNCPDSLCTKRGDFRCQEIKEQMIVAYFSKGSSTVRKQKVEFTISCVCAATRSAPATEGVQRPQKEPKNITSIV